MSCGTEPDCNLPYGGGPVQHTPHVYLVFWGPKWGPTNTATENFVKSFFTDLGQPSDYWSTTVEQYGDKTGHPTFGKGLLVSTYWDKNTPEKSVNNTNLGTEAAAAVNWLHITDTNDADVVIAAQQGTCFAGQRRRHLRRQLRDTPGERLLRLPRLGRQHGELQPLPAVGKPPLPAGRRGRLRPGLHQHARH